MSRRVSAGSNGCHNRTKSARHASLRHSAIPPVDSPRSSWPQATRFHGYKAATRACAARLPPLAATSNVQHTAARAGPDPSRIITSGPPSGYDWRQVVGNSTRDIVSRRFPELLDLVSKGCPCEPAFSCTMSVVLLPSPPLMCLAHVTYNPASWPALSQVCWWYGRGQRRTRSGVQPMATKNRCCCCCLAPRM
jgi:hypothetical protein